MTQDVSLAVRKLFPGAGQSAYLDVASRGLLPESSLAVAQEHLMARVLGRADKARYFELVELARSRFAQLIGAGANVTRPTYTLKAALPSSGTLYNTTTFDNCSPDGNCAAVLITACLGTLFRGSPTSNSPS